MKTRGAAGFRLSNSECYGRKKEHSSPFGLQLQQHGTKRIMCIIESERASTTEKIRFSPVAAENGRHSNLDI